LPELGGAASGFGPDDEGDELDFDVAEAGSR
jgi:hypothetical protein